MLDFWLAVCYNDYSKKSESEEMKMDVREKAIRNFGFEDARTLAICVLVEDGHRELAELLLGTLIEEG